jgi:hypothetical protein
MNNDVDARSEFIQKIFSLDHSSQTFLKDLIQAAMARAEDIGEEDELSFTEATATSGLMQGQGSAREVALEEAVIRAEEAARHLREEQHRLLETIAGLESQNRQLGAGKWSAYTYST